MTDLKSQAYELLRQFAGQANTLTIPRPFITMTGSLEAALLLSQVIYWSDRSTMKDGWFAKSYAEWEDELTLTQYQVSKAVKLLKDFGVETRLKKFKDAPTVHYRIDQAVFLNRIMKFFDNPEIMKNFDNLSTENTRDHIENSEAKASEPASGLEADPVQDEKGAEPPAKKPRKAGKNDPLRDALMNCFGVTPATATKSAFGIYGKAAAEMGEIDFPIDKVQAFYQWCKQQNWNSFTVIAMAKYAGEWLAKQASNADDPYARMFSHIKIIE